MEDRLDDPGMNGRFKIIMIMMMIMDDCYHLATRLPMPKPLVNNHDATSGVTEGTP